MIDDLSSIDRSRRAFGNAMATVQASYRPFEWSEEAAQKERDRMLQIEEERQERAIEIWRMTRTREG